MCKHLAQKQANCSHISDLKSFLLASFKQILRPRFSFVERKEAMLRLFLAVVFALSFAQVATALVTVQLIPSIPVNNLTGGQTFSVDVMVSQDTGVTRNLREARFDFSTTDAAIGLSNLTWDFTSLVSQALYFADPSLPIPAVAFSGSSFTPGFMLALPADGSFLRLGSFDLTAPANLGAYTVNAIAATDDTDINTGAMFAWGFTPDPFVQNLANNGDVLGGTLEITVGTPAAFIIDTDTTWPAQDSPISLQGDVLVIPGATLTIEPGVEVNFNGFFIVISGRILADGSAGSPIRFVGPGEVLLSSFASSDSITNYVIFDSTRLRTVGHSPKVENCSFMGIGRIFFVRPPVNVFDDIIRDCIFVDSATITIQSTRLVFENNDLSMSNLQVYDAESVSILNNRIMDNDPVHHEIFQLERGMNVTGRIEGNTFVGEQFDLDFFRGSFSYNQVSVRSFMAQDATGTWNRNDFAFEFGTGIISGLHFFAQTGSPSLHANNIVGIGPPILSDSLLSVSGGSKGLVVNAQDNWWGTTDIIEIENLVYHFLDNEPRLPYVDYLPIRTAPVTSAGDFNNDDIVDTLDFDAFHTCFTGPGVMLTPPCEAGDLDNDQDIDCDDWQLFKEVWTGPPALPPQSEICDCTSFFITASDPPSGTIDVLQDLSVTGTTPQGIDRIRLTFNCRPIDPTTSGAPIPANFEIVDTAGTAPAVLAVTPVGGSTTEYEIVFSDPLKPGEWTTVIAHVDGPFNVPIDAGTGDRVHMGFLPGDINSSDKVNAQDITALINSLNMVSGLTLPLEQTDLDRSGMANAQDITRLINLLNGVNTTRAWQNESLPAMP